MKKALRFTVWLGVYLIALFTFGMFSTFLNERIQASGFFGDTANIPLAYIGIDPGHTWGARHYWYFWLCVLLFILMLVRIIIWSYFYWEEKPKEKK